jgi:hypothetical protein
MAACAQSIALGAGTPLSFHKHVVDNTFEKGYQVCVADIDRDGLPDVVALSTTPSRLVWYKNPDWTRYDIVSGSERNIDVAPWDIDGDGDIDLALACEFDLGDSLHGGLVRWLECPADPAQPQAWIARDIDRVPTAHRLRWAEITGDGKADLVSLPIIGIGAGAREYRVGVQFKMYQIPEDPRTMEWPRQIIDNALHMAHGISIADWDDIPPFEILTASFEGIHVFQCDAGPSPFQKYLAGSGNRGARPAQGSSEVGLGRLATEKSRFIASIEPWHGHEVVVYSPGMSAEGLWAREVIDDSFNDGHALACADLDGDGNDEIIAGHRGPGHCLYVYRYHSEERRWDRIPLDEGGMSAAGVFVADLNGDDSLDIVAIGTATNNVVWYENRSHDANIAQE